MDVLAEPRLVEPDAGIPHVAAEVAYVTDQVAVAVLRDDLTEMAGESPEDDRRVLFRIALHRQSAYEHEAAAFLHLFLDVTGEIRKRGQRKIVLAESRGTETAVLRLGQRGVDVGDHLRRHGVDPVLVVGEFLAEPVLGAIQKPGRHVWHDLDPLQDWTGTICITGAPEPETRCGAGSRWVIADTGAGSLA